MYPLTKPMKGKAAEKCFCYFVALSAPPRPLLFFVCLSFAFLLLAGYEWERTFRRRRQQIFSSTFSASSSSSLTALTKADFLSYVSAQDEI
jgi:hypothetical protein